MFLLFPSYFCCPHSGFLYALNLTLKISFFLFLLVCPPISVTVYVCNCLCLSVCLFVCLFLHLPPISSDPCLLSPSPPLSLTHRLLPHLPLQVSDCGGKTPLTHRLLPHLPVQVSDCGWKTGAGTADTRVSWSAILLTPLNVRLWKLTPPVQGTSGGCALGLSILTLRLVTWTCTNISGFLPASG